MGCFFLQLLIGQLFYATISMGYCIGSEKEIVQEISGPHDLTEAPHWDIDEQVLYFVDIPNQLLHCYDPATKAITSAYVSTGPLGLVIPVDGQPNKFIGGAGTNLVEITWDRRTNNWNPEIQILARTELDRTGTRFNDGKIDPKGRLWAGTMSLVPDQGSLYRMDSDLSVTKVVSPVSISNGLVWSLDNTIFYFVDSPTKQVVSYYYDNESGDIWDKGTLFDLEEHGIPGIPDGMTIDCKGNLWVAIYNGSRVIAIDAGTGELLRTVNMPVTQVTSVAFGGPELDILYVTSTNERLTLEDLASQPAAGSVFAVTGLGITGTPMRKYELNTPSGLKPKFQNKWHP